METNTNENFNSFDNQQPMPNNNMTLAIIATVVSCITSCWGIIAGIVAIVFASQVKKKYDDGDFVGAEKSAKNAKIAAIVAFVIAAFSLIYTAITWEDQMEQWQQIMEQIEANQ